MATAFRRSADSSAAFPLQAGDLGLDKATFSKLRRRVTAAARRSGELRLELHGLSYPSTGQMAALARLCSDARDRGCKLQVQGLAPELGLALEHAIDALISHEAGSAPIEPLLERVGEATLRVEHEITGWEHFVQKALEAIFIDPFLGYGWRWNAIVEQMDLTGVGGATIVIFISLLVGIVLALNGARQLRQFGAAIFIANLVGVSMTREMGPLITAIMVAGRSGSAIAAELGTMVVAEEIDAMETMALPPNRFLVAPRIIALVLTLPCLTTLSDLFGILGGYVVGVIGMGLGSTNYLSQTAKSLFISDILTGLVKSVVFAILIGLISCYQGLQVSGGALGVGAATTKSVVYAIIAAIAADAIFTLLFYATG